LVSTSINFNLRHYTAGETLLFRGDLCTLWACSFYTVGILEIVESMLVSDDDGEV